MVCALMVQRYYPADFEIQFEGGLGDSVYVDPFGTRVPFRIKNVTHDDEPPFRISDFDQDDEWDPNETISIRPYGAITDGPLITIRFSQDSSEVIHPIAGDIFHIEIGRPFAVDDVYSFTTIASKINSEIAKEQLGSIAVVPNPYNVASSWEPRHQYQSGRGPRKIDFINLPSTCTIKIFTLSGYLVNTLYHNEVFENGTQSWNYFLVIILRYRTECIFTMSMRQAWVSILENLRS